MTFNISAWHEVIHLSSPGMQGEDSFYSSKLIFLEKQGKKGQKLDKS